MRLYARLKLLVGLSDLEVLGVGEQVGGQLRLRILRRAPRPDGASPPPLTGHLD